MSNLYYKIVEVTDKQEVKTLFHGVNGTRVMPFGTPIVAEKKMVDDGGTRYMSGFHVLPTKEECLGYLTRFKNTSNKRIVSCICEGMRSKAHSPSNVWLADVMTLVEFVD